MELVLHLIWIQVVLNAHGNLGSITHNLQIVIVLTLI